MPDPDETSIPAGSGERKGCLTLLVRMSWLEVGPIVLVWLALTMARGANVLRELSFFAVTATIIVLRYLDRTVFTGQTADGKPDTPEAWSRFTMGMIAASTGVWALARFVASRGWV